MNYLRLSSRARVVVALLAASLVTPAHAAKIRVEKMPGADFPRYKTYQWLPPKVLANTGVVENHPVLGPAIKQAIDQQMVLLGFREVAEGGDLQISALALTASIPQLEAVVFGGPNMMYGTPIATMGRYNKEGTLVVNLIDSRTKKSAWVGMIQESIDNKEGSGQQKLPSAAAKLFKKYPTAKR